MARSRRHLALALVALGVAAAAAVGILVVGLHRQSGPTARASARSIGEAVFQAGIAPDGRPTPRVIGQGGGGMMGGGLGMMMGGGCASCHGTDGYGLATQQFTSPNVTYANLTDPKGMLAPDGTRGPTYTDASLRRAITCGIDPEGSHLDWPNAAVAAHRLGVDRAPCLPEDLALTSRAPRY